MAPDLAHRPRVVIVGAGFAGLSAARGLARTPVDLVVIDRQNHHVFQPLLYQVATAALAPTQIATPIRTVLRGQRNASVVMGEVTGIDLHNKFVQLGPRREPFDYLVLATGARHDYFGHSDWEAHAPGLKTLDDAVELRRRVLLAFERAELEPDSAERAKLLTFVVIGGGPTGVETAGAIAELARKALAQDYRRIDPLCARIILVDGAPRLLGAFHSSLSDYARRCLEARSVEVRLDAAVTRIDADGVTLSNGAIAARTVIWAAGVRSSPAAHWTGAAMDRAGRALVDVTLRLPGRDDTFVVGDCAAAIAADGQFLPGVAPAAKQQGVYAARAIRALLAREPLEPFTYVSPGAMATVGRQSAIVDITGLRLQGLLGWLIWSVAHIYFLIGFRNRLAVAMDWIWSYLTFERGARLITGVPIASTASNSAREAA